MKTGLFARGWKALGAAVLVAAIGGACTPPPTPQPDPIPGVTTIQLNDLASVVALSNDGRRILYRNSSGNYVVRDRAAGTDVVLPALERVSRLHLVKNGTAVAWVDSETSATKLLDIASMTAQTVSLGPGGTPLLTGGGGRVTEDGRYVFFVTGDALDPTDDDHPAGQGDFGWDVYRRNLQTGDVRWIGQVPACPIDSPNEGVAVGFVSADGSRAQVRKVPECDFIWDEAVGFRVGCDSYVTFTRAASADLRRMLFTNGDYTRPAYSCEVPTSGPTTSLVQSYRADGSVFDIESSSRMVISPDGRYLAFPYEDENTYVRDTITGQSFVSPVPMDPVGFAAGSPTRLLFGASPGVLPGGNRIGLWDWTASS